MKKTQEVLIKEAAESMVPQLNNIKGVIGSKKSDIVGYQSSIELYQIYINNCERDIDRAEKGLGDFKKELEKKEKILKKTLENISKMPLIKSVRLVEIEAHPSIIIETDMLKRGRRNIGNFKVRISLVDRSLITAVNYYKRYDRYDHPCISDGSICWGDKLEEKVLDFLREGDFFKLIELFMDFIPLTSGDDGFCSWEHFFNNMKEVPFAFEHKYFGGHTGSINLEQMENTAKRLERIRTTVEGAGENLTLENLDQLIKILGEE